MHVLFIDKVHPILEDEMRNFGIECTNGSEWTHADILSRIDRFDGIVIRSKFQVNREFLEKAKGLKFIARSGSGMENIDLDYCEKHNIQCFNSPEGNRVAVAEHLIAMLLGLFNKLTIAQGQIEKGIWNREANRGIELNGKTIGIVGYGNNGQAFAHLLKNFGCRILAFDKYKHGFGDKYVEEVELGDIHREADILSFHVPYTNETHYYFDREFKEKMSKEFYLLNAARGKLVNTKVLIEGLKSGKIKGACLDVIEYERPSFEDFMSNNPPTEFSFLVEAQNVILSPHVAGWTTESYRKLSEILWLKIQNWIINSNQP
ncbi:MAG: NAD(P)-dependent oxidoreductase [Bacteroidota bacterium]